MHFSILLLFSFMTLAVSNLIFDFLIMLNFQEQLSEKRSKDHEYRKKCEPEAD